MSAPYRWLTRCLEWPADPLLSVLSRRDPALWMARRGHLPEGSGGLWFHAASAGEVRGLVTLIRELGPGESKANRSCLATAHTAAGLNSLRRFFPDLPVARAPFDLPAVSRRAVARVNPRLLVLAETEIWPNLLAEARRRGVRLALVNARISDRSLPRYRAIRPVVAAVMRGFEAVAAQSENDAGRLVDLGAPPSAVRVTGNMKHDLELPRAPAPDLPWQDAPLAVLGSLRDGEEEALAEVLKRVAERVRELRIVAAPRHLHRRTAVGRAFHRRGFRVSFRSQGGPSAGDQVLVLDTMGELPGFYVAARVAFVGGTWLPFGGHNVVEPAACGVPVVHGPFVANCRLEAETLSMCGGSAQAARLEDLEEAFRLYLEDDGERRRAGEGGREAVRRLSGATRRTVDLLTKRGLLDRT